MPPRVLTRCSSSFTIGSDAFSDSDTESIEMVIGDDTKDRYSSRASTGSTSTSGWKTPVKGSKGAAKGAAASPRHLTPERQRSIASSRHLTPERQQSLSRQASMNRSSPARGRPGPHPDAESPKASPINRTIKADVGCRSKKGGGSTSKKAPGRTDSARNLRTPPPLLPTLEKQQGPVPTHCSPSTPGKSQYTQFSIRKREQSTPGALTTEPVSSPKAARDLSLAPRHSFGGGDRSSAPPLVSHKSVEPVKPAAREGPPSPTRTPPIAAQQRGTSMPMLVKSSNNALTPTIKSRAPPVIQPAPLQTPFAMQKQNHDIKPATNSSSGAAPVTPPRDLNLNPAQPISRSQTPTRQRKPAAPQLLPSLQAQMSESMIVVHDTDAANKLGLAENVPHSQMQTESSARALTPNLGVRNSGYFQWSIRRTNPGTDSPRASCTGEAA